MSDVTLLLESITSGTASADELLPLVYDELRRLAESRMRREAANHTLQPTALVHEAYVRLVGDKDPGWKSRGHFFGAAAEAMRRILIEAARRKSRLKRGGGAAKEPLLEAASSTIPTGRLLEIDDALDALATEDELAANVVKLRFFAGLTMDEIAEALEVSTRTAHRNWSYAKAWLFDKLGDA
ncbi:MAG: sigma-70 family RNA polymerase sigma factor [Planctomycetota bacterium]